MAVQIRSGPARVIATGEVTSFAGHPLRFDLDHDGAPVAAELVFEDGAAPEVLSEALPGGYRFRLRGFDGADGRGSSVPVLLGEIGDELIFLHFRVFRWGRTEDRTVHFTFFATEKSGVAWEQAAG